MPAADLRAAVVDWLRQFNGELRASTLELLLDEIHGEFAADTAIFVTREAFCDVLRDLHQMPRQHWDRDFQSWHPRSSLDWYASDDASTAQ